MNHLHITLLLFIALFSCKPNQNESISETKLKLPETIDVSTKGTFDEGIIDVDIYFPGNQLGELLKKIDPRKGSIEQQLKTLTGTLSPQEQQKINKLSKSSPFVAMQVILAPLRSTIYVKENVVTAKCDGLSYHLENTVNASSDTGTASVASQANPSNAITFHYDKDFFGSGQFQTKIDTESYVRQVTNETRLIAGYTCKKSIYTSKTNAPMSIARLEVWTSEQMPKSLNFIHPFYVEESNGIMKIDLFANGLDGTAMVYEFKEITSTQISNMELEIKQSSPVYDAKTDLSVISTKLLGIIFGT